MAKKSKKTLASKADKYKCYLASVQSPEHEIDFFNQAFKEEFGRKPKTLREDFCGTFAVCCEWVRGNRKRSAIGVDLDPEPLAWGKKHNFSKLTRHEQDRVQVLQQDVRKANRPRVEVLAAQNFSFWLFKTRSELLEYFRIARSNMADESIMVMDMMGGGECYVEGNVDKRVIKKGKKGFAYHWEQGTFNPVSHDASFYISFKFNDGSKLKRAFEYHWRFWTLAEVRELLAEAGFSHSHVYWEIEDEDGNDTGDWVRADDAVVIRVGFAISWLSADDLRCQLLFTRRGIGHLKPHGVKGCYRSGLSRIAKTDRKPLTDRLGVIVCTERNGDRRPDRGPTLNPVHLADCQYHRVSTSDLSDQWYVASVQSLHKLHQIGHAVTLSFLPTR